MQISPSVNAIQTDMRQITSGAGGFADLVKETSNQIVSSADVKANVSVIKSQDDMMGTLLDIKA